MGRKTMSGNTAVIKIMDCVRNVVTVTAGGSGYGSPMASTMSLTWMGVKQRDDSFSPYRCRVS